MQPLAVPFFPGAISSHRHKITYLVHRSVSPEKVGLQSLWQISTLLFYVYLDSLFYGKPTSSLTCISPTLVFEICEPLLCTLQYHSIALVVEYFLEELLQNLPIVREIFQTLK